MASRIRICLPTLGRPSRELWMGKGRQGTRAEQGGHPQAVGGPYRKARGLSRLAGISRRRELRLWRLGELSCGGAQRRGTMADQFYLENIDEFVTDQNKIVRS